MLSSKKIVICIIFCIVSTFAQIDARSALIQKTEEIRSPNLKTQRSKQCYDLMMLIDGSGQEQVESKNQAIGTALVSSLVEKSFPIIVSRNIVYNVCVQSMSYDPNNTLAKSTIITRASTLLYQINLTDDNWYCYDHPNSEVMLFVPKNYVTQFTDISNKNSNAIMKACGFDTATLKRIDNLSTATLISYIEETNKTKSPKTIPLIKAIESMLLVPYKPNLPTWNIYLTGHGLTNRSIAGLKIDDFFQLLQHFQKIKCSFLHYCSCYAGGYNQNIVKQELSRLNVNFIVSAQGINEEVTYGVDLPSPYNRASYTKFFKRSETFFGKPTQFVKQSIRQKTWQKDPIAEIVSTVIDKNLIDATQPFVYLPATGVFNAITVDKSVKIITKSMAKAYEFENKIMDFTNPEINTIIIYPNYIGIPLKIKAHVAIVSPTQSTDTDIHIFEKIIYQDRLSSIIPNFISFNVKKSLTLFAIKKLECLDYENSQLGDEYTDLISIENMIIAIKEGQLFDKIYALACFNFKEKSFDLGADFEIDVNHKEISSIIFNTYHKKTAEPFLSISRTKNYQNTLHKYLKEKKILPPLKGGIKLVNLITKLESTIDKTTSVQNPGSLQKILLAKQQEAKQCMEAEGLSTKPFEQKQAWSDYFVEKIQAINRYLTETRSAPLKPR